MKRDHVRCGIVFAIIAGLLSLQAGAPARADDLATLEGRVISADGATPRAGVVIALHGETGERLFASTASNGNGAFRIDAARPGRYTLVAEAAEGAFIAADSVVLAAGANPPLALALKPTPEIAPALLQDDALPVAPQANTGLSPAAKWGIAGVIVVGAAAVFTILDDEKKASDF